MSSPTLAVALNEPSFKIKLQAGPLLPAAPTNLNSTGNDAVGPVRNFREAPVEKRSDARTVAVESRPSGSGMDIAVDPNSLVAMLQPRFEEVSSAPTESGSIVVIDNPGPATDPQAIETGGVKNVVIGG